MSWRDLYIECCLAHIVKKMFLTPNLTRQKLHFTQYIRRSWIEEAAVTALDVIHMIFRFWIEEPSLDSARCKSYALQIRVEEAAVTALDVNLLLCRLWIWRDGALCKSYASWTLDWRGSFDSTWRFENRSHGTYPMPLHHLCHYQIPNRTTGLYRAN